MDDLDARGRDSARVACALALAAALGGCATQQPPAPGEVRLGDVPYQMTAQARVGEVPAGFDVRLYLRDGSQVGGRYVSAGRLDRDRYETDYAAWRGDHPGMPAIGDTVALRLRDGTVPEVVFDGFGYHTLEYRDRAHGRRDAIRRDSLVAIESAGLPPAEITAPVLARVPVWTAMRIVQGRDTTVVGLAEIDSIWGPRALNPTAENQLATTAVGSATLVMSGWLVALLVVSSLALVVGFFTAAIGGSP